MNPNIPDQEGKNKIQSRRPGKAARIVQIIIITVLLASGLLFLLAFIGTGDIGILVFSLIILGLGTFLLFVVRKQRKKISKEDRINAATGIGLAHLSNLLDNLWK